MSSDTGATPAVAETSDSTRTTIRWCIPGSHPVLQDHFPGHPIIPAFMQLEAVRDLIESWEGVSPGEVRFRNVKFVAPMEPDREAEIVVNRAAGRAPMSFSISVAGEMVTRGEVSRV